MVKLSQAFVLRLSTQPPPEKATIIWDVELKGFGLLRSPSGLAVWIVKYRAGGRQRKVTLGPATTVLAVPARAKAKEILAQVRLGSDPMAERAAKRDAMSFLTLAERYLTYRVRPRLRPQSAGLVERHLLIDAKRLHRRPVSEILRRDIAETLQRVRERTGKKRIATRDESPVQANRVRASLSAMYVWGMQQGLVEANPVAGTAVPFEEKSRERVLTLDELRAIWRHAGDGRFGTAIKLLMLTGARPGEVGGIQTGELTTLAGPRKPGLGDCLWTVPSERSKNGKPIERLLPEAAVELLYCPATSRQWPTTQSGLSGGTPFTAWRSGMRRLAGRLERAGEKIAHWTPHDLRRSVATHLAELGLAPPHIIEALLGHEPRSVGATHSIYNRAPYRLAVGEALSKWAGVLLGGEVVQFSDHPSSLREKAAITDQD